MLSQLPNSREEDGEKKPNSVECIIVDMLPVSILDSVLD